MARIRSIKPEFWTDEKVVALSPLARLLFIGMWNFVDDEGRGEFSPIGLKLKILPADSADISELLGEIRREGMITVYTVDGKEYFEVKGFAKHQKIDKRSASKLPSPPNSPEFPRIPTTDQGREWIKEEERPSVSCPPSGRADDQSEIDLAFDEYNQTAERLGLPKASKLNTERKTKLRARLRDNGLDGWRKALVMLERSPHCLGQSNGGWRANLDFLLQPSSFIKLIEGAYEGRANGHPARASPEELQARRNAFERTGMWTKKWGDPPADVTPRKPLQLIE